jgi:AraC-like DNA-binding protein
MRASTETVYPTPGYSFCFQRTQDRRLHFNWHRHPEYELCVSIQGTGQAHIADIVDGYDGPAAYLIGPDTPHGIVSRGNFDGWIVQIPARIFERMEGRPECDALRYLLWNARRGLRFSDSVVPELLDRIAEADRAAGFARWLGILACLEVAARDPSPRQCGLAVLLTRDREPLSSATSLLPSAERIAAGPAVDPLEEVISAVFDQAAAPQRLGDISARAGMGISTFCRVFKKRIGMSFVDYLHSIRINNAKKLLIQTHLYIDDICYECGFNNVSFFDRKFKEIAGMTPREYRKAFAPVTESAAEERPHWE